MSKTADYLKVSKIIHSCRTLNQMKVAVNVACNFNRKYKDVLLYSQLNQTIYL